MNENLSKYIKNNREQKNISQRELARKVKIDNSYISRIENGEIQKPTFNLLKKIADVLDVSILELLKIAGYKETEIMHYMIEINNIYDNPLIKNINQDIIDRTITHLSNEIYIDICKVLNEYKKGNITEEDAIRLITACQPIDLDNELIYPSENGAIFIKIEDYY